jgi:hypothetical protein
MVTQTLSFDHRKYQRRHRILCPSDALQVHCRRIEGGRICYSDTLIVFRDEDLRMKSCLIRNWRTHYLVSLKTSDHRHLSRFKSNSRVFNVTFCSPISIRCSDEEEMPNLRANAGRLNRPRRWRRYRPSCFCKDSAMHPLCAEAFPIYGKSWLDVLGELRYPNSLAIGL